MKNIILICSLFNFLFIYSQSEDDISIIKSKIEYINTQSKTYTISILKNNEISSLENSEIAIFTDNSKAIKLIRETYPGETGKTVIWNYIENNHAYFIYKEYFIYKLAVNHKNFNETDYSKSEEGFYLRNDRIIRWMKGKKQVTKYPKNTASIENNMIDHIADLIQKYIQQNK